jgi:Kef-type K+ transport system membrane component KefB
LLYVIILQVLVVLALALVLGELFSQFRLPAVAGELAAGLILGPSFLNVVTVNPQTEGLSSIALFFIIFLIGFQMKTETLRKHFVESVLVTMTSFVIPLIVATLFVISLFPFGMLEDFIVALALAVPSISIISVMVMQYDLIERGTGQLIISSVIVTDVVAFVVLATVSESVRGTLLLLVYLAVFLIIYALVDRLLNMRAASLRNMLNRASRILKREYVSYTILIILGLFVSYIFQLIGLSFIVGAFFAGLILHDELIGKEAFNNFQHVLDSMNQGFFIPIFFGFAGVQATLTSSDYPLLGYLMLTMAASLATSVLLTYFFTKKVMGASSEVDARTVAIILGGRGAVGIVLVTVALSVGLIGTPSYSIVIFGTTVTSVIIPLFLQRKRAQTV